MAKVLNMTAERPSRDSATLWILIPFGLAVVGTVVMLITNSANVLKVSLILALWAAVAGIIITARLRHDRDVATWELEAFQEAQETADDSGVDVEVLREIQEELKVLREKLEELSGRSFEYEPAALRAQARRVAELEHVVDPEDEPEPEPEPVEEAEPVVETEPVEAETPQPEPVVEDTPTPEPVGEDERPTQVMPRPVGAPSADAVAGRVGSTRLSETDENPLSQLISERQAEIQGGRRRRDEHGRDSLTVAELMARSQRSGDKGAQ